MFPHWALVYVANRADHTVERDGAKVFDGGENNIAVYAIDPETGAPTLVQHVDTQSFHVRRFACDPSGRLLVTASIKALAVSDGEVPRSVPAALLCSHRSEGNAGVRTQYDFERGRPAAVLDGDVGLVGPGQKDCDSHTPLETS